MSSGQPIHLLHLIGSTGLYGAERWILAQIRGLDTTLVRATVMNLVEDDGETSVMVAAARERGIRACDFVTGGRFNPLAAVRLARWLRAEDVAIVHGHGFKSDAIGLLAARLARCRVMTTPHGWSREADRKLAMYESLDRGLFRFMDLVCPLSPELVDGIRGRVGEDRLRLIMNGVDLDELADVRPADRSIPPCLTIGYIGQMIERKDISTLLAALGLLRDRGVTYRAILVGDGRQRDGLVAEAARQGLADRVEFTGYRTDATAILKTLDLFVLPSREEGIPRCLMEAMAVGVPVVASDIPGNRQLVRPGETGLLFPPGDSQALAEAIDYVAAHPEAAHSLARQARYAVDKEYSSRRMAREYQALYLQLVDGQR